MERDIFEPFQDENRRDFAHASKTVSAAQPGQSVTPHRLRQRAAHKCGEVRLPFSAFCAEAQRILRLGFFFAVGKDGNVCVAGERTLEDTDFSFNRTPFLRLLALMREKDPQHIGWADRAMEQLLLRGADDDSDNVPPLCSFSANHQLAAAQPTAFASLIHKEQAAGFMGPARAHPPFIPFSIVAGNLVSKAVVDGLITYRKVHDVTWPRVSTLHSCVGGIPLAPNCHSWKGPDRYEWVNPQALAQCAEVFCRLADDTPFRVLLRNSDKAHWFRQIPQAWVDRRKSVVMLDGQYIADHRLVMGKANASSQGDRLTALTVDILEHRFDALFPTFFLTLPPPLCELIRQWDEGRVAVYGPMMEQRRLAVFKAMQDDITSIVFSDELALHVQTLLDNVLTDVLGIAMSTKGEATRPFRPIGETIGVRLMLCGPRRYMAPRLVTQEKFRSMARQLLGMSPSPASTRARVQFVWLRSFIGLYGHMCKFLLGDNALRNSGNMLLRQQPQVPHPVRFVDLQGGFCTDVREVLRYLRHEDFLPLTSNPRAVHGGRLSCAADACMLNGGQDGGWGFLVGTRYAAGLWSPAVRRAFSSGRISISPLEFAVELFAHDMWLQELLQNPSLAATLRGGTSISRSDNLASCMVSKRQLSSAPLMAYFARQQSKLEAKRGVYIVFDHVAGVDNSIPDALSRGQLDKAISLMKESGIAHPTRIDLGARWDNFVADFMGCVDSLQKDEPVWDPTVADGEEAYWEDDPSGELPSALEAALAADVNPAAHT